MLACPKHSYQHHATSLPHPCTTKHTGYVSLMWRKYKWFASCFTFIGLPHLHHVGVDVDLVANLIVLTNTHDVGRQSRNEEDPIK
jgi:hypothetical protein